jgi:cell division protein ZapA (FtsZ GTPase activity inhibitor)
METVETINLVDEYNKLKTENERLREENNNLKSALMNVLFAEVSHVKVTGFTKEKE